jgi:anti-anti-sigma factor
MAQHPISIDGHIGRISLPARFDTMTTPDLRIPFIRLLCDANARHLVIDLSDLRYIDNIGIGTLMAWEKACRVDGKALLLERCSAKIAGMFKRAGVHRLFAFAPTAGC